MVSPEQKMDPQYLRGVMDALELINSFLAWKEANPGTSRTMKEFIKDALKKLEGKLERKLDSVLGIELK